MLQTSKHLPPWRNSPSCRRAEVRRDHRKESTLTTQSRDISVQDLVQPLSAYLPGQKLHTLCRQPVLVSHHPYNKSFFLKRTFKWSSLCFNLCPLQLERSRPLYRWILAKLGERKQSIRLQQNREIGSKNAKFPWHSTNQQIVQTGRGESFQPQLR